MHMFYQYLSIRERPPGDKYIVYRILLLANFKHMFYQYLSICERPPGHLTSRGWKTGRPTSTPPATPFWSCPRRSSLNWPHPVHSITLNQNWKKLGLPWTPLRKVPPEKEMSLWSKVAVRRCWVWGGCVWGCRSVCGAQCVAVVLVISRAGIGPKT